MSCSVFVQERGNISIKPLPPVCAEAVEIGQDGLRQPLQVQPAAYAADKVDVSAVCLLEHGNGFGHFVRCRQRFGRQEGVVGGIEQEQRFGNVFEQRFAGSLAVVVVPVGKAVQRCGEAVVKLAQCFAPCGKCRLKTVERPCFGYQGAEEVARVEQPRDAAVEASACRLCIDGCGDDGSDLRQRVFARSPKYFASALPPSDTPTAYIPR